MLTWLITLCKEENHTDKLFLVTKLKRFHKAKLTNSMYSVGKYM